MVEVVLLLQTYNLEDLIVLNLLANMVKKKTIQGLWQSPIGVIENS